MDLTLLRLSGEFWVEKRKRYSPRTPHEAGFFHEVHMSNNLEQEPSGKPNQNFCLHEGEQFGRKLTQFELDYQTLCMQLRSMGIKPPVIDVASKQDESYNKGES